MPAVFIEVVLMCEEYAIKVDNIIIRRDIFATSLVIHIIRNTILLEILEKLYRWLMPEQKAPLDRIAQWLKLKLAEPLSQLLSYTGFYT
ncbi:hypothetical protein BDR04DRAFT_1155121 [Suillus decipiens]|nr:hypothetical protein BDR04DRAFT_1155121 [Suillus decipiens]